MSKVEYPRKIKPNTRCQHLDMNGCRCKKKAVWEYSYHGDSELYFDRDIPWVVVKLCDAHKTRLEN